MTIWKENGRGGIKDSIEAIFSPQVLFLYFVLFSGKMFNGVNIIFSKFLPFQLVAFFDFQQVMWKKKILLRNTSICDLRKIKHY